MFVGQSACGGSRPARDGGESKAKTLNLYIWSDYLAPDTLSDFEKQTGIKVHAAYFDTNETLETKLLAGSSGFDVVVPTASYLERQIKAGAFLPLDKSKLPNLKNMDPKLMARVALHDPDNAHSIIYLWGTNGIGYNEKMVKALMPDAPLDSWSLVFDPAVASKVAKCGISVLDSPAEMIRMVMSISARSEFAERGAIWLPRKRRWVKIRPYICNIDPEYIEALVNGDLCIAVPTTAMPMRRAIGRARPRTASTSSSMPKEGSIPWFDMLAVPRMRRILSAYAFLKANATPQVIADISTSSATPTPPRGPAAGAERGQGRS